MKIDGQFAIVTGGGSGLGAATAQHLTECGARVAILDYDIDKAKSVAAAIDGIALHVDVSDQSAVGAAVEQAANHFGANPRIAVNCAGVGLAARIVGRGGKMSFDVFEKTIQINLLGTYYVMSHAARLMQEQEPNEDGERGVIINTASAAYEDGQVGQSAYAASKGAIASMCLPAAREFGRSGIRVVAIAPGLFHTPMMEGLPEEVTDKIISDIQFPTRLGRAAEYAQLAEHIITNPYLNGTTIRIDGATRLPPR